MKALLRYFALISFLFSLFCCTNALIQREEYVLSNTLTKSVICSSDSIQYYAGHKYEVTNPLYSIDNKRIADNEEALSPTHKAIRIMPTDIRQLHDIEKDSSLLILYHPFNYKRIDDDVVPSKAILSIQQTEGYECNECGDVEISIEIYPIYVFWPINREIPQSIHYEYYYDAYIPTVNDNNRYYPSIQGRLMAYDNRLLDYMPIGNADLQYYRNNQNLAITASDDDGYFSLLDAQQNTSVNIVLQNDRFTVRDSITTNAASVFVSDISSYITNNYASINLPTTFILDVFKAAQYYFMGWNSLLNQVTSYYSTGDEIDIFAVNGRDLENGYLGCFDHTYVPCIVIWNPYVNTYLGASSKIFGTVSHELGHATHYATDGHIQMINTDRVIKESFALFFGWYQVKEYYSSIIVSDNSVNTICTQGRQNWTQSSTSLYYTPLYVDLFDNFNQKDSLGVQYNKDAISNVPISAILGASLGFISFQDVEDQLYDYVGTYYSMINYEDFIEPYSSFE